MIGMRVAAGDESCLFNACCSAKPGCAPPYSDSTAESRARVRFSRGFAGTPRSINVPRRRMKRIFLLVIEGTEKQCLSFVDHIIQTADELLSIFRRRGGIMSE